MSWVKKAWRCRSFELGVAEAVVSVRDGDPQHGHGLMNQTYLSWAFSIER